MTCYTTKIASSFDDAIATCNSETAKLFEPVDTTVGDGSRVGWFLSNGEEAWVGMKYLDGEYVLILHKPLTYEYNSLYCMYILKGLIHTTGEMKFEPFFKTIF